MEKMKKILQELNGCNQEEVLKLLKPPVSNDLKKLIIKDRNILNESVIKEYFSLLKRLLEIGASPNTQAYNKPYKHYKTSFFFAAAYIANPKFLELFIKYNVNINLKENKNFREEFDIFKVLSCERNNENKHEKLRMLVKYKINTLKKYRNKINLQRIFIFESSQVYHFFKHNEKIMAFWLLKFGIDTKGVLSKFSRKTILMEIFYYTEIIEYKSLPAIKYVIENSTTFSQKDRNDRTLIDIIEEESYYRGGFKINRACNIAQKFVIAAIRSKKASMEC